MENDKDFHYTYSAKEQEEIRAIQRKYDPRRPEENKLEQIRRLDRSVGRPGKILALVQGIIGVLVFGVGMSLVMVWEKMVSGILVGLAGIAILVLIYPIKNAIDKKRRAEFAPAILQLTEELKK